MATVKRVQGPAAATLKLGLHQLDTVVGKVGWFKGSAYPNGGPTVAYVAAIQEHGYPEGGIPPRLGMRSTAIEKKNAWAETANKGAKRVINGQMTAAQLMDLIGQEGAGDLRAHISGPIRPPLKPATVLARLRRAAPGTVSKNVISVTAAHPLTDTKLLLNTLSNTVEPAGGGE